MNIDSPLRSLTPHQYSLLLEQARRDALRLRREAIADFWSAVARAARAGLQAMRRHVSTSAARTPATPKATPCPR